jgi:hypothetical protein
MKNKIMNPLYYYYSFIHMCIHCLSHFSLLPPLPPSPPHPLPGETCSAQKEEERNSNIGGEFDLSPLYTCIEIPK